MKLEIYNAEEKPEEQVIRLRLVALHAGVIALQAVDTNGKKVDCGNLLFLSETGRISCAGNVNGALGFDLWKNGELKID